MHGGSVRGVHAPGLYVLRGRLWIGTSFVNWALNVVPRPNPGEAAVRSPPCVRGNPRAIVNPIPLPPASVSEGIT
jgi:hypothetical protein